MDFVLLLRFVVLTNLTLILSRLIQIQGRLPTNVISYKSLTSDIYRLISFEFALMIENTKLYPVIPVLVTLTIIQGQSWMRNKK